MLFTSYEFIGFLILLVIIYYLIPKKYQWMLLLLASYFFYTFSGIRNIFFIIATTISTFLCAIKISKAGMDTKVYIREHKEEMSVADRKEYREKTRKRQRFYLIFALIINFGLLLALKILGLSGIILPLGMSFYTFTAMGYLVDVYRGKYESQNNLGKFALYVSFFPQLIQGPINRYDDMSESLFRKHNFDIGIISFGLQRILWGFFKKLVIADRILPAVKILIGDTGTYSGVYVFIAMVLYATELYADFTGGIDITIGIAQLFGIDMNENFVRPFFSKTLAEYWRRWHISLGKWFTDYIFYPLSIAEPTLKTARWIRTHINDYIGKRYPVYAASMVTWFLTGLWHGMGWNFVVWGLANGIILMISQELEPLFGRFHNRFHTGKAFALFTIIRTLFITSALRMLDLYRNVGLTFSMLFDMIVHPGFDRLFDGTLSTIGLSVADCINIIAGVILMTAVSFIGRKEDPRRRLLALPAAGRYAIFFALLLVIIIFGAYGIGYDASQFIYNQF